MHIAPAPVDRRHHRSITVYMLADYASGRDMPAAGLVAGAEYSSTLDYQSNIGDHTRVSSTYY